MSAAGPALAQNLSAIARPTAEIDDSRRVGQLDSGREIDGWLRPLVSESQVKLWRPRLALLSVQWRICTINGPNVNRIWSGQRAEVRGIYKPCRPAGA